MKHVVDWLETQSTLTLATVGPDGEPAAADLYFVADERFRLYFLSEHGTRHAAHIGSGGRVSATIHSQAWDWRDIRGVQLAGECHPLTSTRERTAALARYGRKFSFLGAFAALLPRHALFRITPTWIRWLDNSAGFGYRQEWTRKDGRWISADEGT